jgi:hypothetical protein
MFAMSIAMRRAAIEMNDPDLEEHADALEAEARRAHPQSASWIPS